MGWVVARRITSGQRDEVVSFQEISFWPDETSALRAANAHRGYGPPVRALPVEEGETLDDAWRRTFK